MSDTININIHNGSGGYIHIGSEQRESLPAAAQWQVISREPARLQLTDGGFIVPSAGACPDPCCG